MPITAISPQREAYCPYKSQNPFPAENAEKLTVINGIEFSLSVHCSRNLKKYGKATHILA
jgi:hypothetical protein